MSVYGALFSSFSTMSVDSPAIDTGHVDSARTFARRDRSGRPDIGNDVITLVALQSAHAAAGSVAAIAGAMIKDLARLA